MREEPSSPLRTLLAVVLALAAPMALFAAGPSKPFSVFVAHPNEADAVLAERLDRAVSAVAEQLAERGEWFRIVDAAEEADIRVTVFDAQAVPNEPRHVGGPAGFTANRMFDSAGRAHFSFDAVVRADGKRRRVRGAGAGASGAASLEDAAADFLSRLERFAGAASRNGV